MIEIKNMVNFGNQGDLPDELALRIFGFFGDLKNIRTISNVCESWHRISSDNSIWLKLLIQDFHFTEETAKALRKRRDNRTYKELYRYCKNYSFNDCQQNALDNFQSRGLTHAHLCGRDWFDSNHHVHVLRLLLPEFPSSDEIDKAMEVLDGLTRYQAEVLKALSGSSGHITLDDIAVVRQSFHDSSYYFHPGALKHLLKTMQFNEAMQVINSLTFTEAYGIAHELTIEQMRGLKNQQIIALVTLKRQGVNVNEARQALEKLTPKQVEKIINGSTLEQVLNIPQTQAHEPPQTQAHEPTESQKQDFAGAPHLRTFW